MNVGKSIDNGIPYCGTSPKRFLKNRVCNSVYLEPVTDNEIISIIESSNPRKSVGPYSIPVKLLKIIKVPISRLLTMMVNESFVYGNFPNRLKAGKVIPLHKQGSTLDTSNYRHISLPLVFSKILEKLMHQRIYKFLETHNILYPSQFGFRESTLPFMLLSISLKK